MRTRSNSKDNLGHISAALRDLAINYNRAVGDLESLRMADSMDVLMAWTGVAQAAGATSGLSIGSTDTNVATGSFTYSIAGVRATKAAVTAGTAIGALGTTAADQWAVFGIEVATGGTISFTAGAGNVAGYATEALAIAAVPKVITGKARLGYFTVKTMAATAWIAGTDALAGGTTGNEASQTNYYPTFGVATPTGDRNYVGGANGIVVPTELSRGTTVTLASSAFIYNANGVTALNKAATTATAFGALGTIPAGKWGLVVVYIDAAGALSFQSAPLNYTTGYATEAAAKKDLVFVTKPANKVRVGYITVLTKDASTAFIFATDSLAGGATGNVAATTNYYNQAGLLGAGIGVTQPYQQGMLAGEIGDGLTSGTDADLTVNAFSQLIGTGI